MQPLAQQVIVCPPSAKQIFNAGNTRIIFSYDTLLFHTILHTAFLFDRALGHSACYLILDKHKEYHGWDYHKGGCRHHVSPI